MEGRGVGWLMKGDMGDEGLRGGVWWCVVVCGELGCGIRVEFEICAFEFLDREGRLDYPFRCYRYRLRVFVPRIPTRMPVVAAEGIDPILDSFGFLA